MLMDETQAVLDLTLSEIRRRTPYFRSVVLIGSRAAGGTTAVPSSSDYDVVVVVPTWRVALAMRSLRGVAAAVRKRCDAVVTVNPAPVWRIRRGSGNLMVLKLLREGRVIAGRPLSEYRPRQSTGQVGAFWHFFYMSSQAMRLCQALAQATASHAQNEHGAGAVATLRYVSAKVELACAETRVMAFDGRYVADPHELLTNAAVLDNGRLRSRIEHSIDVIRSPGNDDQVGREDALRDWDEARQSVMALGQELSARHFGAGFINDPVFEARFLRSAGKMRFVRNAQYFALNLVANGTVDWRALVAASGVAERLKLASFHLLAAASPDGVPSFGPVAGTRKIAELVRRPLPPGGDAADGDQWQAAYKEVARLYPAACVALGL